MRMLISSVLISVCLVAFSTVAQDHDAFSIGEAFELNQVESVDLNLSQDESEVGVSFAVIKIDAKSERIQSFLNQNIERGFSLEDASYGSDSGFEVGWRMHL